jgi:outer membrane protein
MNSLIIKRLTTKIVIAAAFFVFTATSLDAQKIAVVDINAVLQAMPAYTKAQDDLDKLASRWRQEIAQEQDVIKGLYSKYQTEQVLMSEDVRKQKEEEIANKEKNVREMQRVKFGPEGELFKKRQELVKPIQEKVYVAIEAYANEKGYDSIFDKGGSAGLLFANERYDMTAAIKDRLK